MDDIERAAIAARGIRPRRPGHHRRRGSRERGARSHDNPILTPFRRSSENGTFAVPISTVNLPSLFSVTGAVNVYRQDARSQPGFPRCTGSRVRCPTDNCPIPTAVPFRLMVTGIPCRIDPRNLRQLMHECADGCRAARGGAAAGRLRTPMIALTADSSASMSSSPETTMASAGLIVGEQRPAHLANAGALVHRGHRVSADRQAVSSDRLQVYPKTFVTGTVDADARVPGR